MKNDLSFRCVALFMGLCLMSTLSSAAIRAKGSDSTIQAVKALASAFEEKTGTVIQVSGGGSRAGAQAVIAGESELAFLSRALDGKEKSSGLVASIYARDAMAGIAIFATKGESSSEVKAFIEFARSDEGQKIVAKNELLALN